MVSVGIWGCDVPRPPLLESQKTTALRYCREHAAECRAEIGPGQAPAPSVPTDASNTTSLEVRINAAREAYFREWWDGWNTGNGLRAASLLVPSLRERNRTDPARVGTRPVRVRGIDSVDAPPETLAMTMEEFDILHYADLSLSLYAQARGAMCRDRDGRRYIFVGFPSDRDEARGVSCAMLTNNIPLQRWLLDPIYPDERTEVSIMARDEAYPLVCAIQPDGTVPDLHRCRTPSHVADSGTNSPRR